MKKLILILLLVSASLQAQLLKTINLKSPELAMHQLDHIQEKEIDVYLPPSYLKGIKSYPVLYFLPGYGCGYFDKEKMISNYHQAIINDGFDEMIIVFIEGCTASTNGSFFVNSDVTGHWDDFIVNNVIPYIDKQYRTLSDKKSRAIAGHSMGGFGAFNMGMLHPDVFCAVYAHSPGLFNENGLENSHLFNQKNHILACAKYIEQLGAMDKESASLKFKKDIKTMPFPQRFAFEYGMAIAPNLKNNAPYVDYPFTIVDGKLVKDEVIWHLWESGFGGGFHELEEHREALLQLESLIIDYGTNDYYTWIPEGCLYYSQLMNDLNINHKLLHYTGPHILLSRYNDVMFPELMKILKY